MRFSLRRFLIAAPIAAILLWLAIFLWCGFNYGVDDAYSQWGAAQLVIGYMQEHDGQWPRNWESLREEFDAGYHMGAGWSFEQFQRRIEIDFEVDVDALREAALASDRPTFRVIRATRTNLLRGDFEPNRMIYEYLRAPHLQPRLRPQRQAVTP